MKPVEMQELVGKTIANIDDDCVNVIKLTFTDGSKYSLWSECARDGFPYTYLEEENVRTL